VTWPWHFWLRPPPADRSSGTTVVGRTTIPSPLPRPFMVGSNNPKLNIDTAPLPAQPLVLPPSSSPPPQTRPLGHERERRVLVGQASTHPCTTDGHISFPNMKLQYNLSSLPGGPASRGRTGACPHATYFRNMKDTIQLELVARQAGLDRNLLRPSAELNPTSAHDDSRHRRCYTGPFCTIPQA
jgi:hypothetical protein